MLVKQTFIRQLPILVLCLMISACVTQEQVGMVTGAALGGALGAQVKSEHRSTRDAAIILGAMAGGFIGGSIGRNMDQQDKMYTQQVLENNPTNESRSWQNPDTNTHYTVTPTRTYEADHQPCRDYVVEASIDGRKQDIHGTACRDENGVWQTSS